MKTDRFTVYLCIKCISLTNFIQICMFQAHIFHVTFAHSSPIDCTTPLLSRGLGAAVVLLVARRSQPDESTCMRHTRLVLNSKQSFSANCVKKKPSLTCYVTYRQRRRDRFILIPMVCECNELDWISNSAHRLLISAAHRVLALQNKVRWWRSHQQTTSLGLY